MSKKVVGPFPDANQTGPIGHIFALSGASSGLALGPIGNILPQRIPPYKVTGFGVTLLE